MQSPKQEGNTEAEEGGNIEELLQSAIPSDEENETTDQQPALDESSHTPTIEGDCLQHSDTLPEPTQTPSSVSTIVEATPVESSNQESLQNDATKRPPRRAAQ